MVAPPSVPLSWGEASLVSLKDVLEKEVFKHGAIRPLGEAFRPLTPFLKRGRKNSFVATMVEKLRFLKLFTVLKNDHAINI